MLSNMLVMLFFITTSHAKIADMTNTEFAEIADMTNAEFAEIDSRNGTNLIHYVQQPLREFGEVNTESIKIIYIIFMVASIQIILYLFLTKLCCLLNMILESLYMVRTEPVNTDSTNNSSQQRIVKPFLNRLFFWIIKIVANTVFIILFATNIYNAVVLREHLFKTTLFDIVYHKFILCVNYQWVAIWMKALKMPLKVALESLDSFCLYLSGINYCQLYNDLMSFIFNVVEWFTVILNEVETILKGNVTVNQN